MALSVPTVFYELNYRRKKIKTHTSQGIVKNKCTKPTKEWLDVAIWLQVIFSEYSKVFRIGTKSVTQNRCKKFPRAT